MILCVGLVELMLCQFGCGIAHAVAGPMGSTEGLSRLSAGGCLFL